MAVSAWSLTGIPVWRHLVVCIASSVRCSGSRRALTSIWKLVGLRTSARQPALRGSKKYFETGVPRSASKRGHGVLMVWGVTFLF